MYYKQSVFTITFRSVADFLRCSDKEWDMLGDVPISIRHDKPSIVMREIFLAIPQWVIIMELRLFAKLAVNVISSVIGQPNHAWGILEHLVSSHSLKICIMMMPEFSYPKANLILIKEENGSETELSLSMECQTRPQRCSICKAFEHWTAKEIPTTPSSEVDINQ